MIVNLLRGALLALTGRYMDLNCSLWKKNLLEVSTSLVVGKTRPESGQVVRLFLLVF